LMRMNSDIKVIAILFGHPQKKSKNA